MTGCGLRTGGGGRTGREGGAGGGGGGGGAGGGGQGGGGGGEDRGGEDRGGSGGSGSGTVAPHQVAVGLAAHHGACLAVAAEDDGRPQRAVVVVAEREAVRTGGRNGDQVARPGVTQRYAGA